MTGARRAFRIDLSRPTEGCEAFARLGSCSLLFLLGRHFAKRLGCAAMSIGVGPVGLRTICCMILCAASVVDQLAHAQTIAKVVPGSVRPGDTTEIKIEGAKLTGAVRVWASFAAGVEVVSGDSKSKEEVKHITCRLTLPPHVSIGIGGIVVATPTGVSDVNYLMIDDLETVAESANNHAPAQAQEVTLPAAIDGESDGTLADYFRVRLKSGESVSVEVVAARLGQDFDASSACSMKAAPN